MMVTLAKGQLHRVDGERSDTRASVCLVCQGCPGFGGIVESRQGSANATIGTLTTTWLQLAQLHEQGSSVTKFAMTLT